VRRSRTEHLQIVQADGKHVEIATAQRSPGELTTQDVFQVSPDGAYLAYASEKVLHVRSADGNERTLADYLSRSLMRFSPDGKYLAAVLGEERPRVVLLDLATGQAQSLADFARVKQLEWMRDGVLASVSENRKDLLVALSPTASPRTLRESNYLDRFVAAATGTRIVVFENEPSDSATHVIAFDAARPAETHELATVTDSITNAAASLDGQHVAFTTALALWTATGDQKAQAISDRGGIHSLWYAHDGRLGYATPTSATVLEGGRAHRFDTEGPILMLRFDPLSQRALVATSTHAWDAMGSGRIAQEPELLGVDHFAGGLVVWTGHVTVTHGW